MLKNNQAWSTLCADDADNDGRSNGEELGDPSCSWVPCDETNTNCDKLTAVSHPGILYKEIFSSVLFSTSCRLASRTLGEFQFTFTLFFSYCIFLKHSTLK